MTQNKTRTYKTSDIGLAATFIVGCYVGEGDELVKMGTMKLLYPQPIMNRPSANRGQEMFHFVFEDNESRPKITNAYAGKRAMVEPCAFQNTIRNLKQQVKEFRQNREEQ